MKRLRELRKSKNMTMKELADLFHLGESTISMYENGQREPNNEIITKLADYFQVSIDFLLGREFEQPQEFFRDCDKRWQARWQRNGIKYAVYDKNQKTCYEKLKKSLSENKPCQQQKIIKLNQWVKKWIEVYKKPKVKDSTLYSINIVINKYVTNSIGLKEIKKINSLTAQEFLNKITSTKQRKKIYILLKDCFDKALKNKIIAENPFALIETPKHTVKESKAMTNEQEKNFVKVIENSKYKNVYLISLYEGLRIGEVLALNYEDIDFNKKLITVNKTFDERTKKTTSPKTKNSNRVIPLFKRTETALKAFSGKSGRICQVSLVSIHDDFHKCLKQANLKDFIIHSLRHTFITRATEIGIDINVIAKWVGHANTLITKKIYTHVNLDFEQQNINIFDSTFDPTFNK